MARWLPASKSDELLTFALPGGDERSVGELIITDAQRSVPAIDPLGLAVTSRALLQAAHFESELLRSKLSALAELAAGAGHELNNPLGTILGRAQQLLREESDPERRRRLSTIGAQVLRLRDMISDLMLFARPVIPRRLPLDLVTVIREIIPSLIPPGQREVDVLFDLPEELPLRADRTQVEIVLTELLRNALQAVGVRGTILFTGRFLESLTSGSGQMVQLSVSDTGPGLTPVEREHLFDPFYSGRPAGRSLGFGLSKCLQIVTAHEGTIHLEDPPPLLAEGQTSLKNQITFGFSVSTFWPANDADGVV